MYDLDFKNANILIVDDQEFNIDVLVGLLVFQGYTNIRTTTDPRDVISLFNSFQPDLILLDLMMPFLTGYEVMAQLKEIIPQGSYLPILVLTADITPDSKKRALTGGANDFLSKPFDLIEVGLRIKNLLYTRFIHLQLQNQNLTLEEKVRQRTYELEKSNNELIKAKNKAEESDRLKTAFLNNIQHEIRTPFNGIIGFLSLLKNENFTENDKEEFLEDIKESSNRFMNTINDLIIISKIHTGQMEQTISSVNINMMTSEIFYSFKHNAERKGLEFNIFNNISNDHECINTDSEKINTILSQLLRNAIKFTKDGSVDFIINRNSEDIIFVIKDTGIGISQNNLVTIFDRFIQGDLSRTREFEGSGLGLAIVSAYVDILGGKIRVESEEGKGSTFYFSLPS